MREEHEARFAPNGVLFLRPPFPLLLAALSARRTGLSVNLELEYTTFHLQVQKGLSTNSRGAMGERLNAEGLYH